MIETESSEMTRERVAEEIAKRAPWYQRIDFPKYDLSTTDDPANAFPDQAWDNKIGDISIEEATRLRPVPKWQEIKSKLPSFLAKDVLEIGCNCGFWSFYFASSGAKSVTGLDISEAWLDKARWANEVLGYKNVKFQNIDFMAYTGHEAGSRGLLTDRDAGVPLPNNVHDIVFMSTVLDHLFFPFFAIYKMFRIAREFVIIDVPQLIQIDLDSRIMHMGIAPDKSHHGFVFKKDLLLTYFERLGVPERSIRCHEYNEGANICYIVDVRDRVERLRGA